MVKRTAKVSVKFVVETSNFTDKIRGLRNEVASATEKVNSFKKSLRKMAVGFVGLAALQRGISASVNSFADFSAALSDLSALTGAVGTDLKFLEDASKSFAKTTTLSATKVVTAFKLVGSVKADLLSNLPALKAVTKQVIMLSEASQVDLATAAKVTGTTLNQFGLAASEASRVVNVLAAGSKEGAAEVDDLGQSLSFVGTIASQSGLNLEQTVAALEILAANGIKSTRAGTGLRSVLLSLSTQSNSNFNPSIVGLSAALKNLNKSSLSSTERLKLFGKVGITTANALQKNVSALDKMESKVTGTSVALSQASTQNRSFSADLKRLSNVLDLVAISFGKLIASTKIVDALTIALKALAVAANSIPQIPQLLVSGKQEGLRKRATNQAFGAAFSLFKPDFKKNSTPEKRGESFIPSLLFAEREKTSQGLKGGRSSIPSISENLDLMREELKVRKELLKTLENQVSSSLSGNEKSLTGGIINKITAPLNKDFSEKALGGISENFIKASREYVKTVRSLSSESNPAVRAELEKRLSTQRTDLGLSANRPPVARGLKGGGTFSTFGSNSKESSLIKNNVLQELDKFAKREKELKKGVKITGQVTVTPDKVAFIEFTGEKVRQMTLKEAQATAQSGG